MSNIECNEKIVTSSDNMEDEPQQNLTGLTTTSSYVPDQIAPNLKPLDNYVEECIRKMSDPPSEIPFYIIPQTIRSELTALTYGDVRCREVDMYRLNVDMSDINADIKLVQTRKVHNEETVEELKRLIRAACAELEELTNKIDFLRNTDTTQLMRAPRLLELRGLDTSMKEIVNHIHNRIENMSKPIDEQIKDLCDRIEEVENDLAQHVEDLRTMSQKHKQIVKEFNSLLAKRATRRNTVPMVELSGEEILYAYNRKALA